MLVEMSHVRLIGLKEHFFDVIDTLHSFGRIHFNDITPKIDSGELPVTAMRLFDRSAREEETIVSQLQRTRAIIKGVFGDADMPAPFEVGENELLKLDNAKLIAEGERLLGDLEPQASAMVSELEDLKKELAELVRYEPLLNKIEPIVSQLTASKQDYDAMALLVERRYRPVFEEFRTVLDRMTNGHSEVVIEDLDDESVAAIVLFEKPYSSAVRSFLTGENINQIKLPQEFESIPLPEALVAMHARIDTLGGVIVAAEEAIARFGEKNLVYLTKLRNACSDRIAQLDIIAMFGETKYTFVITGWVPTADVDELREVVARGWAQSVVVEECEIAPKEFDEVPVAMSNSGRYRPFEAALSIWGLPRYGSIDPTRILAISFPFIFGMIVGDAGYGLLLLLICLFLRKKFPENKAAQVFSGLMIPTSIMTIVFGIFYFEFFGDLAHVYIPVINQLHPIQIGAGFSIPFVRTSKMMLNTFLVMAVGFGVLHVMFGLALGIINGKRGGERSHVIMRSGLLTMSLAAVLLAAVLAIPALTSGLGDVAAALVQYIAYFLLAFGFVTAVWGGGIMGAVETIETVSHMASYIRIMAVGLVGALLADAANELVFVTMPNAAGIVIALMLHVLNFAVILFSPTIHALRLNFLEFFGGFFEQGSKIYKPFVRTGEEG